MRLLKVVLERQIFLNQGGANNEESRSSHRDLYGITSVSTSLMISMLDQGACIITWFGGQLSFLFRVRRHQFLWLFWKLLEAWIVGGVWTILRKYSIKVEIVQICDTIFQVNVQRHLMELQKRSDEEQGRRRRLKIEHQRACNLWYNHSVDQKRLQVDWNHFWSIGKLIQSIEIWNNLGTITHLCFQSFRTLNQLNNTSD